MNAEKQASAKRAWAELTEQNRRRTFAFIGALALLYKSGQLSKAEVVQKLNDAHISREDLRNFRRAVSAV